MSDLRPTGIPITLGGEQRNLLFTINAIDEVQSQTGKSMDDVIEELTDQKTSLQTLKLLVTALINDEIRRERHYGRSKAEEVTEEEVGWMLSQENIVEATAAVLRAYGYSLPEPDEFASPNAESGPTG